MIKTIQISDQLFWGFNKTINLDSFTSFEEIANFMQRELITFLKTHNFLNLVDIAKDLKLHCHLCNNYKDLYKYNEKIIYFCGSGCLLV